MSDSDGTGGGTGNGLDGGAGTGGGVGTLTVSGGGIQVATDTVFAELAALTLLHDDAGHWQGQIDRIRALGLGPAPGWQPDDLGACVFGASVAIDAIAERSRRLADALTQTAEEYGHLEAGLATAMRVAGGWLGHTLGLLAPLVALSVATPLAYLAAGSLLANAVLGRSTSVVPPGLSDWLRENPRLLTNPVTVAMVRALVSSADDVVLGRMGVPYPVAALLGEDGAGVLDARASALGLLVAARAAGMLRETPVRVTQVRSSTAPVGGGGAQFLSPGPATGLPGLPLGPALGRPGLPVGPATSRPGPPPPFPLGPGAGPPALPSTLPPTPPSTMLRSPPAGTEGRNLPPVTVDLPQPVPPAGFGDLADRIPTEEDGGQVRIERYGNAEHPAWLVYIGGTVEWSPTGSSDPWDMTSNVTAVADQEAGSYRAVLKAMQAAGVQPGDPVLPVAHSQGGLIANELVARGEINAVGMVTFGSPETGLPLPDGLPAIAVEHSDDIVPALGSTAHEDGRLYVRRELFAGTAVPADEPLPAHQLVGYRDTARLVDGSPDPTVLAFRERLDQIVGTTPGQQSLWRSERAE